MIYQTNTLAVNALSSLMAVSSPVADIDVYKRIDFDANGDYSIVINDPRNALVRNVFDCWQSATKANWDGHDALPMPFETCRHAVEFVDALALSSDLKLPEVAAEPDGEISFDWYVDEFNQLSVSIGIDGLVSYAARIGGDARFGSYRIEAQRRISEDVREVVARIAA